MDEAGDRPLAAVPGVTVEDEREVDGPGDVTADRDTLGRGRDAG